MCTIRWHLPSKTFHEIQIWMELLRSSWERHRFLRSDLRTCPRCLLSLKPSKWPPDDSQADAAQRAPRGFPDAPRWRLHAPSSMIAPPLCLLNDSFSMIPLTMIPPSRFLVIDFSSMIPRIGLQRNSVEGLVLGSFFFIKFMLRPLHSFGKWVGRLWVDQGSCCVLTACH